MDGRARVDGWPERHGRPLRRRDPSFLGRRRALLERLGQQELALTLRPHFCRGLGGLRGGLRCLGLDGVESLCA